MSLVDDQRREQTRLAWSGFFHSRFPPDNGVPVPELDYELELLEQFALLAKRRRNARVWAYRLPVELLSMIFELLSRTWPPKVVDKREEREDGDSETDEDESAYDPGDDDVRYRFGWITISHVCSLWRKVSFSTPSLWSEVNCAHLSPCCRKILFENAMSHNTPFALILDYKNKPSNVGSVAWTRKWLDTSICSRVHRLELLNLPEDDERLTDVLRALPNLARLTDLSVKRRMAVWDEPEPVFIPFSLSIPSPHQLERVSFLNCFPPLSSPIFSANLTHLSLELMFSSPERAVPSVDDVIGMLSPMHRLEELTLDSFPIQRSLATAASQATRVPSHNTHILPPSFRKFTYTGDDYNEGIASVVKLISRLTFPSNTEINLALEFNRYEEDDTTAYLYLLKTIIRSINGLHTPSWMLEVHQWSPCIVLAGRLSSTSLDASSIDWTHPLQQHIAKDESAHIHFDRIFGYPGISALCLLRVLPPAQLTCLVLDSRSLGQCFPSGELPMPELLVARSLRRLSVELPAATSVFEVLRKTRSDGVTIAPVVFPDLECITLQRDPVVSVEDDKSAKMLETLLSGLDEVLVARQDCVTPIRQLFINKNFERAHHWQTIARTTLTFFGFPSKY